MSFSDMLYGMTTIIEATCMGKSLQGSGFYYTALSEREPDKKEQWREVKGTWLVTNRHVALPKINDKEMLPETFTFNLREIVGDKVQWLPITLDRTEYQKRLKIHNEAQIDVATIDVGDLITEHIKSGTSVMNFVGITNDHLPEQSKLSINVGDDILVAGYPRGFYDMENKFPIVKSGVISSNWGQSFNGKPLFLIDSKLFPGSSGSVVITKPQYVAMIDKKLMYSEEGDFVFLGIYSGEPIRQNRPVVFEDMTIIRNDSYNVGNVWYSYLVPEIISSGIQFS